MSRLYNASALGFITLFGVITSVYSFKPEFEKTARERSLNQQIEKKATQQPAANKNDGLAAEGAKSTQPPDDLAKRETDNSLS
ncbi:hypothetical protein EV356DRAFT_498201 [Viridothelium virens]|uniref:Uncharacterized protein n=1 Tax=Viridothelium virens TaxID=1048519 RepID=A0A6A6HGQ6_VIRVR|nr:hypothetical protein EV356DRAFT_498201 [Viridothelium virens]